MITKRVIATPISPLNAAYRPRELGIVVVGKIVCTLMKISGSATVHLRKGNPLLGRLNILMRRSLKAGFLERFGLN